MDKYEVVAYEKDGGIYDTIFKTPSKALAERVAVCIQKLINRGGYVRHDNGEPYDWTMIYDADGTRVYSESLQKVYDGGCAV